MNKYNIIIIILLALAWGVEGINNTANSTAPQTTENSNITEDYSVLNPTDLQQWVAIAAPANTPDRLCHATVYDPVNDKIYMIGGNPSGTSGLYQTLCQQYNPTNNTWTDKAPMPTARGWIYGAYVRGKIYVIGGASNTGVTSVNEEYDIAGNSWTTKAPRPTALQCDLEVVWRDSLIYCLGGWNGVSNGPGTTVVDIYNPFTNTWSVGTPLPMNGDMGTAVIIDDTIYITNAINRLGTTGSCWPSLYKGAINPANPTQITWIQGPVFPSVTFNAGSAVLNDNIYWLGGFVNASTVTNACWKYDRFSGTITTVVSYPQTIARCNYMVARPLAHELYVMAGDAQGNWSTPNNYYYKIKYAPDVGVDAIISPSTTHLVNTPMTPIASVKNYGIAAQTNFSVTCSIVGRGDTLRYFNTRTIPFLAAGRDTAISFQTWTPTIVELCSVKMRTNLIDDGNSANDRKTIATNIGNTSQVTIGTATTNSYLGPLSRFFNYSTHEAIYLRDEINTTGNITHLAYFKNSGSNVSPINNVTIYMKHTSASTLTTGFYNLTDYTQVFSGSFTNNASSGWMQVALTTPFSYNNTDNLQILIIKGYQAYLASGYPYWRYTTTSPVYRTRQRAIDENQPDSLVQTYNRPNIMFTISLAGIEEQTPHKTPLVTMLNAPKPNPVTNGLTHIAFTLASPTRARLKIYDAYGRLIETLVNEYLKAGSYTYKFEIRNSKFEIPAGIYFYTLETEKEHFTKKLVLMR